MRSWGKSLCLEGQQKLSSKKASAPPEDNAAAKKLLASRVGVTSGEETSGCRKLPRGILFLVIGGGLSLLFGCLSILWTPFDILMRERLKMVPGLPPFEWWKSPPDEVLLRVYVFNITNAEEFLSGADRKLKMEEIGPFIFLEKLEHRNVSFHSNQTMTYTAVRSAVWLPEKNNISLNGTLIVPNLAVLGIASYIYDANFMTKFAYNMLVRGLKSKPLIETSIYNYLWNFSDPFLHVTKKILPFMVPATNIGMLSMIYLDFQDEVTVYIGPENVKKFFTMDKFHGSDRFNYWPDEICDSVKTATEGVIYPQFLTRNDSLAYFRKTMCRITPVYYAADVEQEGIAAYRFDLPNNIYDRPENLDEECYTNYKAPLLPSGLTDVSPCFYDFPIAASNPHFLNADPKVFDIVEGMKPERNKHYSYVIVEPTTGIPLESRARSQSNLIMRKIKGIPIAEKFSDLIIPMFWAEYNQVGLPDYVFNLMYFMVKVLPILQTWLSFFMVVLGSGMFLSGLYLISCVFREKRHNKSYSPIDLIQISS